MGFHCSPWVVGGAAVGMADLATLQELELDQACPGLLSSLLCSPITVQDLSLIPGLGKLVGAVCYGGSCCRLLFPRQRIVVYDDDLSLLPLSMVSSLYQAAFSP